MMDVVDMTEEQVEEEYEAQRQRMCNSIELQYISDEEELRSNTHIRETYSKVQYPPFNPQRPQQQQDLSQAAHEERQMRYQQGEERDRADRLNETLYDIPDDDILDNEDIREDGNNEEPILPTIHEDEDKDMPSSPPTPIQHARPHKYFRY
ncbi:hypothetical protein GMDG_07421 [Pseudogymnoascus destructans 20631-21]|uniref:Uncharacterized protein n=1 Tax=Pseudogymnoascus destructans (strain ATCC MYA-4855 / 20631-21) TaxID=658429 RepID=L8FY70_PSED2|nr:hypothetical protein GMDG_07421 [Pseudogymnoascus destructans 20631-21]